MRKERSHQYPEKAKIKQNDKSGNNRKKVENRTLNMQRSKNSYAGAHSNYK